MNGPDRHKRDQKIERLFNRGLQPSDIANRVKLKVDRVRDVLIQRGVLKTESIERLHDGIWGADRDTLARRIWQRQRDGARAALRVMGQR